MNPSYDLYDLELLCFKIYKAFDLLESREIVTFSVHPAKSTEFITVHLTSLGREIFKGLSDEA